MFVVTEAEAAAIRAIFEQRGEFAAAVELRRRFPSIADTAQATGSKGCCSHMGSNRQYVLTSRACGRFRHPFDGEAVGFHRLLTAEVRPGCGGRC
jgi:hypothetical protein